MISSSSSSSNTISSSSNSSATKVSTAPPLAKTLVCSISSSSSSTDSINTGTVLSGASPASRAFFMEGRTGGLRRMTGISALARSSLRAPPLGNSESGISSRLMSSEGMFLSSLRTTRPRRSRSLRRTPSSNTTTIATITRIASKSIIRIVSFASTNRSTKDQQITWPPVRQLHQYLRQPAVTHLAHAL